MESTSVILNSSAIDTLIGTGAKIGQPISTEQIHYALVPKDMDVRSLKDLQYPHGMPPNRICAAPALHDVDSFCSYVNAYKDARTRLFANPQTNSFTAVLDYHSAGNPEFLSHKASLTLRLSEEWTIWYGNHDKLIPQLVFAEFLEDNRTDIIRPDSATMLEVARDLQAHSDVNFASKINTVNGSAQLKWDETISSKVGAGVIDCPETFAIRVPVFFGEQPITVEARLRFRIGDGKLKFQYKLYRPAETLSLAFDAARERVKVVAGMDVLLGALTGQ